MIRVLNIDIVSRETMNKNYKKKYTIKLLVLDISIFYRKLVYFCVKHDNSIKNNKMFHVKHKNY